MLNMTLLDNDLGRITTCEKRLESIIRKLGIKACVYKNMEPPYLSRLSFTGRFPAIEINGDIWARDLDDPFTEQELAALFKKLGFQSG